MKLGIGTVQFGIDYGVSNNEGQTSFEEVVKILEIARINGIDTLDTAQVYGNSEKVLGKLVTNDFKILTKVQTPIDFVKSLRNLNCKNIYGLMFHNAENLINNPEFWRVFELYKKENKVKKIGVSVYNLEQLYKIIEKHQIDIVQLPINLLDQRFKDCLKDLKSRQIEIHARSIFLQGLLLMNIDNINPYFTPINPVLKQYFKELENKNLSKLEGAFGFIKSIKNIDCIIIGVNNHEQLINNIKAFNKKFDFNYLNYRIDDEKFINPSKWCLQ